MNERQACLRDRAVEALRADPRVRAAWLAGSFATGQADDWSDLDIHCCVSDDAAERLAGDGWRELLAAITPTVLAVTFPPPTLGGLLADARLGPPRPRVPPARRARVGG